MKLESFKDKKVARRKMLLFSIGLITIIGVSLLLYKTFASFSEEVSFPMMSGKVNYYGNADLIFAFYNGDQELDEMPQKGNPDNFVYDHGTCDNGATIEWNEEKWAPLVLNIKNTKTRCNLYFKIKKEYHLDQNVTIASGGSGLYKVEHNTTGIDEGWNQTEYRYAGLKPSNYVRFNNEIWRIIGLVNVKTNEGAIEQRLKIVRMNGIEGQKDFGYYAWDDNGSINWTTSTLKNLLNGIYYNSENGEGKCYYNTDLGVVSVNCNFSTGESLPKGLNEEARQMVDNEVIWNLGIAFPAQGSSIETIYINERNTSIANDSYPTEWTKENDETYHKGIGILNVSDFGYSIGEYTISGGTMRKECFNDINISNFETKVLSYGQRCHETSYMYSSFPNSSNKNSTPYVWFIDLYSLSINLYPYSIGMYASNIRIQNDFSTYDNIVWPTLYLKKNVTLINGNGSLNNPYDLAFE